MDLQLSSEVKDALETRSAVVALETSVVAHGLPHPQNLQAAHGCEDAVRRSGAIPAAIAVIEGKLCIGLSARQILTRLDELLSEVVGACLGRERDVSGR